MLRLRTNAAGAKYAGKVNMTTKDAEISEISGQNLEKLNDNLRKVEELSARLTRVMQTRTGHQPSLDGPDQALFAQAATAYWAEAMQNPAKVIEHQLDYWSQSVKHFVEAQQALSKGTLQAPEDPGPADRRFSNPMWNTHPYFNFVKKQYQINAAALSQAVDDVTDRAPRTRP